jgi:hypothetical protein
MNETWLAINHWSTGLSSAIRPSGSLAMKKQSPCQVYHMEAFHGAARRITCAKEDRNAFHAWAPQRRPEEVL